MQIELLEPGIAVPKGRGYVGVGDPGDTIYFPHVDSCMAIVAIFDKTRLIGGHIGAQWPGHHEVDYKFCGNQILTLMEANRKRVKADACTTLILVYPGSTGWKDVASAAYGSWSPDAMIDIDTTFCAKGADITVTATTITLVDCKTNLSKEYAVPTGDFEMKTKKFPND
jgi:hypothetical protein